MQLISIVVPCYNEEDTIRLFYDELCSVIDKMKKYRFEIIFINDGSKDKTLQIIKSLVQKDHRIKYLSFSRNFGEEAGIYAGLVNASGDFCVKMDVDLQDPPYLIKSMMEYLEEDRELDCVAVRRGDRKNEPVVRSFFAKIFYKLINKISDAEIVDGAREYRMMTRQMVNAIVNMKEYNRFSKGIFSWVGFNTKWLEYDNVERSGGTSKWSFWSLLKYAFQGICSFSSAPLQIATLFGLLFSLIAFVMVIVVIAQTIFLGGTVAGWPSLVCIILVIGGVQLLSIGVLGQYISRIYLEVKNRPLYIEKESNIKSKDTDEC